MSKPKRCEARTYGDEKQCGRCGLAWDVSDPEPPECLTTEELRQQRGRAALSEIRDELNR